MQLIKEKYKYSGSDFKIKIPLSNVINFNGLQDSIDDFINNEVGVSINPIVDGETFRYKSSGNKSIIPKFWNSSNSSHQNSYLTAGFTNDEIINKSNVIENSFFIMQVYDTPFIDNQILLHSSYFSGYNINSSMPLINIDLNNEFSNFYLPNWWINEKLKEIEGTNQGIGIYIKLIFYNAKTGKLQLFYNGDKENVTTEDKTYYFGIINLLNKNYSISGSTLNFNEYNNSDYINKINESISTFKNEKPEYPLGKYFNNDGDYLEI